MNSFRQPGLLGPISPVGPSVSKPQGLPPQAGFAPSGSAWKFPGQDVVDDRRQEQARHPERLAPPSATDDLRNAWNDPNSLRYVINRWREHQRANTVILGAIARYRQFTDVQELLGALKDFRDFAKKAPLIVKIAKLAASGARGFALDFAIGELERLTKEEQAHIGHWLPRAEARLQELVRR